MSSNIIYTSIDQVVSSCTSLEQQLAMIDMILINMLTAINTATTTGQFQEYKLDTGQTKSEVRYRSLLELQKAFQGMSKTKEMIMAELNKNKTGRVASLVGAKNFTGFGGPYFNG